MTNPEVTQADVALAEDVVSGKHTPGPWQVQPPSPYPEDNGLCIIGLRLDDRGEPLETPTNGLVAVATQTPVEADEGDYERATANARLIAAAPEVADASAAVIEGWDNALGQEEMDRRIDALRAALTAPSDRA